MRAVTQNRLPDRVCIPAGSRLPRFGPLQRLAGHGERRCSPATSQAAGSVCALRVSHSLDALLPPCPAGLVSSRFHSWGFPFEASSLLRCRTASRLPQPPGFRQGAHPQRKRQRCHQARPAWVLLTTKSRPWGPGISPAVPQSLPPWAFPSKASYDSDCRLMHLHPLTRSFE
jgi:hypothetical protein